MIRRLAALLLCCLLVCSAAYGEGQVPLLTGDPASIKSSGVGFYFDTVVSITLYGADDELLQDIWSMCSRYESLLSKTVEGSDVTRINQSAGTPVTVDPDTYAILQEAKEINRVSGGDFSITLAPIIAMWDFTKGTCRMPTDEERLAALPLVDDETLILGEDCTVTLPQGCMIDLGGIAKGYIADRIAALVEGRCTGATISLGGNTYCVGKKPNGQPWSIGIQDPNSSTGTPLAVIAIEDGTVVTSGTYERCFEKDGTLYHHILDPRTGTSSTSDLVSATIVCHNSMLADALATACIVKGSEGAALLLAQQGLDGVLITKDGSIIVTEGFVQKYNLRNYK